MSTTDSTQRQVSADGRRKELARAITRTRASRRLALTLLVGILVLLIALGLFGEEIMGKDQRMLTATIALCIYLTSFPILGYTYLVWWKHAREARMLEEGLTSRPLFHQAQAVLKRLLARFAIGIGWMLVSFFGFGISTLYREARQNGIADVLFEYGGWLLFIVSLITFLFLGFWIKCVVEVGYELLARAAKQQPSPVADKHSSYEGVCPREGRFIASWINRIVLAILASGAFLAFAVKLHLWKPPEAVLMVIVIGLASTLIIGTAIGWWYGWREEKKLNKEVHL